VHLGKVDPQKYSKPQHQASRSQPPVLQQARQQPFTDRGNFAGSHWWKEETQPKRDSDLSNYRDSEQS